MAYLNQSGLRRFWQGVKGKVLTLSAYGGSASGIVKAADKLATARKIGNASFDGSSDVTLDLIGLGNVNNTADSDKNVASAGKLRIKTITNLADASQYANAFCYYSAGVIGSPPTQTDGVLIGLNYGLWGAQIAFPTSGGIYARSGSTFFSAWTRLDQ